MSDFENISPESVGISSLQIDKFLNRILEEKIEMHSFMFLKDGKVFAEGYYYPYTKDTKNYIYSCSKTVTATAIGFLIDEGRISVDDYVVHFMEETDLPEKIHQKYLQMTIRHLLTMSAGLNHEPNILMSGNWRKLYFESKFVANPGELFCYNSLNTYILSVIVTKVTGLGLVDYLMPRLFEPLGIERPTWAECPEGYAIGGWGLSLTSRSLAKIVQCLLDDGQWAQQQVIPANWVQDMLSKHIDSSYYNDAQDYICGYGYQVWKCHDNSFRLDGVFGQLGFIVKDKNMTIIVTAGRFDSQAIMNIIYDTIISPPDNLIPNDERHNDTGLVARIANLHADHHFDEPIGEYKLDYLSVEAKFINRVVSILPLAVVAFFGAPIYKSKGFELEFNDQEWLFKWETQKILHPIRIGLNGDYIRNVLSLSGQDYVIYATGYVIKDNVIRLYLRIVDTPHTKVIDIKLEDLIAVVDVGEIPQISELSDYFAVNPMLTGSKELNKLIVGGGLKMVNIPSIATIKKYTKG